MKKTGARKTEVEPHEVREEYRLSGGAVNPYAARYAEGTNLVLIEPELFASFPSAEAVNEALRILQRARMEALRKAS